MADQSTATLGLGNPYSAANLIAHGLKRASSVNMMQLPSTEQLRKERLEVLLNTSTGRDFTINTGVGVAFKVHSMMLIGGPKALEQAAFPQNPSNEKAINLPDRFHPHLVDRLVAFIYTSSYSIGANATKVTTLHHHASLPAGATSTSFGISIQSTEFHICLYGMAEELEYSALMSCAYSKLAQDFIFNRKAPENVVQLIKILFAPAGSQDRKCKDEVGALKDLSIAATLVHEKKHWSKHEANDFLDQLADELDQDVWKEFRQRYKQIKAANQSLLIEPTAATMRQGKGQAASQATPGMESLVSHMTNVDLAGDSKPNVLEQLHDLFDEYAYWAKSALRKKTGASIRTLNVALPKIAEQIQDGQFNGFWQRKAHFNRSSLFACTEQMGRVKPLPLLRSQLQPPHHSRDVNVGIGQQPVAGTTNFLSRIPALQSNLFTRSDDGALAANLRENKLLAKRKLAKPSRKIITTPSGMKIIDNDGNEDDMQHDGADTTAMMGSKHAPKAPKLGEKDSAGMTFCFAGAEKWVDFSDVPKTGSISLDGLKALQAAGVANTRAKEKVEAGEKNEDPEANKENIPLKPNYAAPTVEEEQERDEVMLD